MSTHLASSAPDIFTDPTIQEFEDWIQSHQCPGVIFKPESTASACFVPDKDIQEYFDCSRESNHNKVKKLVEAATRQSTGPVNAKTVAESCPKIFTILVLIGYSRFIPSFVRNARLRDRRLPFRADEARLFPKLEGGTTFFDKFNSQQWQFCVEPLGQNLSLEPVQFDDPMVLPITCMKKLDKGSGNSAVVHKISIHEDYDGLEVLEEDEQSRSQQLNAQNPHVYVVKSYHRLDAERYFYAEAEAFRKLNESGQPVPNLIGFYGAFKQNGSFNIVLQYANIGTLEHYFVKVRPPKLGNDIVNLWRNLFKLTDALVDIHGLPQENDSGQPRIFQGWHQDIKPANVLVAGDKDKDPYGVQFMLADLGLSHFTATIENSAGATGEDKGGTRAYSSPEMYKRRGAISDSNIHVKQKNDTWALACVYSEVNAWVVEGVDGSHGLEMYRTQRQEETEAHGNPMGSCFHNHRGLLLESVSGWHDKLKSVKVTQDHVTPIIWDNLLRHMFVPYERRLSAHQVQFYSGDVLEKAEKMLPRPPTRSETAPASVTSPPSPPKTPPELPPEYQDRKQHFRDSMLSSHVTPHRDSQKYSHSPELHQLGTMQSPDSLRASGSPPHTSKDRESLAMMDDMRGLAVADDPGLRGMHRPTSADLVDRTSPGVSQAGMAGHDSERFRHSAHEPFYGHANFVDAPPEMTTERPTDFTERFRARTQTEKHQAYPANIDEFDKRDVPPAIAELSSEAASHSNRKTGESIPNVPQTDKPPKELSVGDLKKWAEMTKASSSLWGTKEYLLPFEAELLGELKRRDHIFVVDDAESMRRHWPELNSLFADLIYMVKKKKLDPNGSELRFIMSDDRKEARDTTELILMVNQMRMRLKGQTNFAKRLDEIFEAYKEKLGKRGKTKPISLYVLTDGVWQPGNGQLNMVASSIKRMVAHLESLGAMSKMVGIQFIRFGNDPTGIQRLRWLDSQLKKDWLLARDICDTTSSSGNVWKMMLGSINDYWDDDPDD